MINSVPMCEYYLNINYEKVIILSDLRVEKTKKAILNAYMELRTKKPLDKITIKELCEKAVISKQTFYLHYSDIYSLCGEIEDNAINEIFKTFDKPEAIAADYKAFINELISLSYSLVSTMNYIFCDTRRPIIIDKYEKKIIALLVRAFPEFGTNIRLQATLTYIIHGTYNTFMRYLKTSPKESIAVLVSINELIAENLGELKKSA